MKQVLLVVNPCAGNKRARKCLPDVISALAQSGYENIVYLTTGRGHATEIVRERASGVDLVVCLGGDGTMNETVQGLLALEKRPPVGYVPLGTTNDFASSLKLSGKVEIAARQAATGTPHLIDMGSFNGRGFTYVASFGAFTGTSYSTSQTLKNALGHMAYILSGIKDLGNIHRIPMRITCGDKLYEGDYIFGAISNSTSIGGILTLDESLVDMSDGMLEVMLIKMPKNIFELNKIVQSLRTGDYNNEWMTFFSAAEMEIETDGNTPWSLDGEYEPGAAHISVKNIHNAIEMIF